MKLPWGALWLDGDKDRIATLLRDGTKAGILTDADHLDDALGLVPDLVREKIGS